MTKRLELSPKSFICRWSHFLEGALFFLFFFWFWGVRHGEFLSVVRGFSLFPPTSLERWETIAEPGGILELCALTLAPTFEFPLFGALVLACLALAIQKLTFALWHDDRSKSERGRYICSFLPSFLATFLLIDVGLDLFESTYATFYFGATFGVLATLLLALLGRRSVLRFRRRVYLTILVACSYPMLGAFSFSFALTAIGLEASRDQRLTRRDLVFLTFLFVVGALAPLVWGRCCWQAYDVARLYRAGLIQESTVTLLPHTFARQLLACLLLLLLPGCGVFSLFLTRTIREHMSSLTTLKSSARRLARNRRGRKRGAKRAQTLGGSDVEQGTSERVPSSRRARELALLPTVCLTMFALVFLYAAPRDELFMATVKVVDAFDRGDFEKVLTIESRVREPSEALIAIRNVTLHLRGELGERLFERPTFDGSQLSLFLVSSYRISGDDVLFYWGFDNLATRAAMNNYVATRGRSSHANKTLALTAIDRGDTALAERYLRRLERSWTLGDRVWAGKMRSFVDAPNERSTALDPREDYIATGIISPEQIVVQGLARRDDLSTSELGDKSTRRCFEARLAYALLDGNFGVFSSELDAYWNACELTRLPKAFEESALFLERMKLLDASKFNVASETRSRFNEFVKYVELYRRNHESDLLEGLREEFGDTAWFYFIFQQSNEEGRTQS